jgi:type VI secretion system secreted protein Hcp
MAIYLKIEGIDGNSEDADHDKWIEVLSFSWGATCPSNVGHGAGAARGTSSVQAVQVSCISAKSSIELMHSCVTGKHFPKVLLEATKATGDGEKKWLAIELNDVMISSFQEGGDGADGIVASAGVHGFDIKTRTPS